MPKAYLPLSCCFQRETGLAGVKSAVEVWDRSLTNVKVCNLSVAPKKRRVLLLPAGGFFFGLLAEDIEHLEGVA